MRDARNTVYPEKPQRSIAIYLLGAALVLAIITWVITVGGPETMMDMKGMKIGPDPTP